MDKFRLETFTDVNVYNEENTGVIQEVKTFIIEANTEQEAKSIAQDELNVTEVVSIAML